ncbi:hypothetical protein B0H19DRAFT_1259787 [Mycena capillaripes]|nr:hypothetical protein B0H19DRAFT_1259787 [Mycena capillaripes]
MSDENEPVTIALFSTNHPSYVINAMLHLHTISDTAQNVPFAIANNVNPQANKAMILLPHIIPGPGYTIGLIGMSNTSDVLASSPPFAIVPGASSSGLKMATSPVSSAHASSTHSASTVHTGWTSRIVANMTSLASTAVSSSVRFAVSSIASANFPVFSRPEAVMPSFLFPNSASFTGTQLTYYHAYNSLLFSVHLTYALPPAPHTA